MHRFTDRGVFLFVQSPKNKLPSDTYNGFLLKKMALSWHMSTKEKLFQSTIFRLRVLVNYSTDLTYEPHPRFPSLSAGVTYSVLVEMFQNSDKSPPEKFLSVLV
jgi:hypothetical protein